jgi:enoyl-CoA hydratase/carnithine racemase
MAPILSENESGVALITLNDASNGNTLSAKSLSALVQILHDAIFDKNVRVLLLRSNGPTFCLGMSLSEAGTTGAGPDEIEKIISLYCECLFTLYTSPKPVVCCITGEVKAGGVGLVSACDIVIASSGASFQLSEIFLGMIPANVLPFLFSLRLSPQTVRYLVLTGKKVSASEAYRIQLINELFSEETLEQELKVILKGLFRASPAAIARAKQFTGMLLGNTIPSSIEQAKKVFMEMMRNPEITNAINDFNNGLTPPWFSRFSPQNPLIRTGAL